MKTHHNYFLLLVFSVSILFTACQKNNYKLDKIDPDTQPSELSRALLIENAINREGQAPEPQGDSNLRITNSQNTALISSDNFLFLPFVYNSNGEIEGIYLQIEGADNYWEIRFDPKDIGQQTAEVISIGVPANVIDGQFYINYNLFDGNGSTGNSRDLVTTVTLPKDFCEGSISSFPRVEGSDGIFNQTYTFGEEAGFIAIEFETFSVPDRVDIRYNKQWIRSTGDLLTGNAPPIKECHKVVPGDGFLGQDGVFNVFYDPKISRDLTVYVSGCLDGGTAWEFEIKECPKDKAVLGIHSNVPPSDTPLELVLIGNETKWGSEENLGHAWISLTKSGQTTFYGLWPDDHNRTVNNGSDSDVRVNLEKGFGSESRFFPIDENQEELFKNLVSQNRTWSYNYTCAGFAETIYNSLTPENLDGSEFVIGFGTTFTPRKLAEAIRQLEKQNPTSSYRPKDVPEDSSSCSFCL